jgi:hypothetical protein
VREGLETSSGDVRKYPTVYEGDWVRPYMRGYRIECCDCGLIHRLDFRVRKGDRAAGENLSVELRAFRDNRATAQIRRWRDWRTRTGRRTIMLTDKQVRMLMAAYFKVELRLSDSAAAEAAKTVSAHVTAREPSTSALAASLRRGLKQAIRHAEKTRRAKR